MLHTQHAAIAFFMDVFEHITIIDLTGGGFISSRIVTDLKITDLLPALIDIINDISFITLHMVDIIKYFHGSTSYSLTDYIVLMRTTQEKIRIVAQWLQHHYQPVWFQYSGA